MGALAAIVIQRKMVEKEPAYTYMLVKMVVYETTSQDIKAVMGSLDTLLQHIRTIYSQIKKIILQSDCAPAVHGYGNVVYLNMPNQYFGQHEIPHCW